MMKQKIAVVLTGALLISMAAAPVQAEEQGNSAESTFVHVYTGTFHEQEYSTDLNRYLAKSECPQVTLDKEQKEAYPALAEAFEALNEKMKAESDETYQMILEDAKERLAEDPDYDTAFTDTQEYYVLRSDQHIVSILGLFSGYTGGAHGYYGYHTENFDTGSGDTLKLTDLVLDGEAFMSLVKEAVTTQYPETEENLVNSYFEETPADEMLWTAGYEGITCYFGPYTLGPYAIGSQTVLIPYEGNESLFAETAKDVPENFGIDVPMSEKVKIGGRELEIYGNYSEYDSFDGVTIYLDGEPYNFDDDLFAYSISAMYLRTNSREYLYLECLEDNDYRMLAIFSLGEKAELVGTASLGTGSFYDEEHGYSASTSLPDPENMLFTTTLNLLGTGGGERIYRVGDDGMPEAVEPYFHFVGERVLTTKVEISAEEVDEDGTVIGEIQIPAGTALTMYRSDDISLVDLKEEDGRIVRVEVSADTFPQTIGGKEIDNLFDGVMFAG